MVPLKKVRGYRLSDLTTHGTTQKCVRIQIVRPPPHGTAQKCAKTQIVRPQHTWNTLKRRKDTDCQTVPNRAPLKKVQGYRLSHLTTHGSTQKGARIQIVRPQHT